MALIEGGNPTGVSGAIEGAQLRTFRRRVVIASADVLTLNATPVEIVPAPGAGFANIFEGALMRKPAGTAYTVAAGEDLSVKYTDENGDEVAQCETTGFLDQATNQVRWVRAHSAASADSSITPVDDAALVVHMLAGEVADGDSDLELEVHYRVVKTVP